jgi:DNA-binding transcriptional MerR regulator
LVDQPLSRIGELAARLGVSVPVLRMWEQRYGVVVPVRSERGFRLYSGGDERLLRRMVSLVHAGIAPREAARVVRAEAAASPSPAPDVPALAKLRAELQAALEAFDDSRAQGVFDRLFGGFGLAAALSGAVLPCLAALGDAWAEGRLSVAHEHFASTLIRARLLALARGWDAGGGERAVLACPPDERHDVGLIAFGLVLHESGWRVVFFGADTPVEAINVAAAALSPGLVTLSSVDADKVQAAVSGLRLPASTALAIGGEAVRELPPGRGILLPLDPVEAARAVGSAGTLPAWAAGG